jgi:hypothetical protein
MWSRVSELGLDQKKCRKDPSKKMYKSMNWFVSLLVPGKLLICLKRRPSCLREFSPESYYLFQAHPWLLLGCICPSLCTVVIALIGVLTLLKTVGSQLLTPTVNRWDTKPARISTLILILDGHV